MNPHCVKLTHGPRWRYIIQRGTFVIVTIYVLNQCHSIEVIVGPHFLLFDNYSYASVTVLMYISTSSLLCVIKFNTL